MILGHGTAQTDEAIIMEYQQFLLETHKAETPSLIFERLRSTPGTMQRRIGKSIAQWTDQDILGLYNNRCKATWYPYSAFLAFLFFRGYCHATLHLLTTLPFGLTRHHRRALAPYHQKLQRAQQDLRYASTATGSELNLLITLLILVGKPLEKLTRSEFDAFQTEYQTWYRKIRRADGGCDSRLSRLETYLVHWGIFTRSQTVFRHDEHFARLRHVFIRAGILAHMQWCEARHRPSTIRSRRAAMLHFFLWFQERYPDRGHLDQVTRSIALDYARYLRDLAEDGKYSSHYASDLYRCIRLFFNFTIDERLETSPERNPFTRSDMPRNPDPVPRYLSDHDVRTLLAYCQNGASSKERTMVLTLLHTGIRAAELAALKASDIVLIQGQQKLHIHQGKGLKDRLIPLTSQCLAALQAWQEHGWECINDHLFTHHGRPWQNGTPVCTIIRELGCKLKIKGLTPHRFRHTFAVTLLNYGIRESALQKLMGHSTLDMTLQYARILDPTVEQAFNTAVERMQTGPLSWVPSFLASEDYTLFCQEDAVNWIRLPHGYCRRHPKLHCESDVKCLLCDRYCSSPADLPQLQEMHQQFLKFDMKVKADAVAIHIYRLKALIDTGEQQVRENPCSLST